MHARVPVEASEKHRVQLTRGFEISALVQHMIELVRVCPSRVCQCDPRELTGEDASESSGCGHQRRNTRTFISRMFAPSSMSAVGIWPLITAFSSGSSSRAVGTILQFAAIAVIR